MRSAPRDTNASVTSADLRQLLHARAVLPGDELRPHLASKDADTVEAALALAALSGDRSLAPLIVGRLGKHTQAAAIALGELGATEHADALVARLPRKQASLASTALLVALERMHATSVIPALRAYLDHAPPDLLWDVHHALAMLTGFEPVLPLHPGRRKQQAAAIRDAWRRYTGDEAPRIEPTGDAFVLHAGRGVIGVDYAPPTPGSSWPRWGKMLYAAGTPLYHLQSDCGTCETTLGLAGFPAPLDAAARVRDVVADVREVTPALLDALGPLVSCLRSGHYLVRLVDLPIERVDDPSRSWLHRRVEHRPDAEPDEAPIGMGTPHYQLPAPVRLDPPTFGVLAPTQPITALDEDTVTRFAAERRRGAQPTAIALAWYESRHVEMTFEEGFLVAAILDGHHKLEAAARGGTRARILLLCRIEDSWGPPEDRAAWIRRATEPFRVA